MLAVVPDLICIVDRERYQPLLTEDLRYGLRVAVVLIPSAPKMNTEQALKFVGPKAFGYENVEYKPIGGYKDQKSEVTHSTI